MKWKGEGLWPCSGGQSLGERILSRVNHTSSFAGRGSQSQNFHVYFPSVEWPFPFASPSGPAAEKIVSPIATVEFDSSHSRAQRKGRWMPSKTCTPKRNLRRPFAPLSPFTKTLLPLIWRNSIYCIIYLKYSLLLRFDEFVLNYLLAAILFLSVNNWKWKIVIALRCVY